MLILRFVKGLQYTRSSDILLKRQTVAAVLVNPKNNKATTKKEEDTNIEMEDLDRPIQYSTSQAAKWRASNIRASDAPWYQSYIVSGCLTVFLLYFMVLREENDIDQELDKLLTDRLPDVFVPKGSTEKKVNQ